MAAGVWDGRRPRTPRQQIRRTNVSAAGIDLAFVRENVERPTDWCFDESHHVIVVHRAGQLKSMEIEFERGPSGPVLPQIGDVWVIPAGHRYAALALGHTVDFCEMVVPTAAFGDRPLTPTIRHRDPLAHAIVEKLSAIAGRDDHLTRLLTDSLAETLRLHLADQFAVNPVAKPRRTLDRATQARLVEYLEDNMSDDLTLDALARTAEMSTSQFAKAFASAFHTTPHQYLIDRRIARAKTLLATSTRTIADISADVGFSTPSHFATTFKTRVGVSPSTYRQIGP